MRNKTRYSLLGGIALSLGAAVCAIQAADALRGPDKPASPRSLPGDNLPPFGMLDEGGHLVPPLPPPPGGYHHGGPGTPPESTAPGPSLDVAIAGARAAVNDCMSRGYQGAATVVDSVGEARAMLSADGSDGSHVFVAHRKALTALAFKMPSAKAKELVPNNKAMLVQVTPNMFVQFGAFPITLKGQVIGAIGYSGGDDEACALVGSKEIQRRLAAG